MGRYRQWHGRRHASARRAQKCQRFCFSQSPNGPREIYPPAGIDRPDRNGAGRVSAIAEQIAFCLAPCADRGGPEPAHETLRGGGAIARVEVAGLASLTQMLEEDAMALAGPPHARAVDKPGYRWGRTKGPVGFHGGKVEMELPRVRSKATGKELPLPSWKEAAEGGWLEQWATSLMLMNVATRKVGRAVRLPEAGVPAEAGSGLSKSAVSRRIKALTQAHLEEWMGSDLSALDLLVIQFDGLHMDDNLLMLGAVGVDADGRKHPLGVVEGATENAATVRALTKAIRRTFGADNPDPTLPDPQGAQHHRAARSQASRRRPPCPSAGMGN